MKISSVSELQKIAKKIKQKINIGDSILLYGDIGVGKTTFTRLLINNISQTNRKIEVLSPTFNIVIEYFVNKINIRHFDLYRLKKVQDINNIGLFENLNQSLTIIEWPEKLKKKPKNRVELHFKYKNDMKARNLKILKFGNPKKYEFRL